MFIDSYIPKRLNTLLAGMVNQYVSDTEEQLKPNQLKTLKNGMACLVYNISHCVSTGANEFVVTLNPNDFSKPIIYNGNIVKRRVSYTWFKRCLYWMVEKELLSLSVGSVETWKVTPCGVRPDKVSNSLVAVSEELVDVFKPVSSKSHIEINRNVLILRDEGGCDLPFRLKDYHYRLIELLDLYNSEMLRTDISVGDSKYFIQSCRVYNQDWFSGGRFYLRGTRVMSELLKKENRDKIMIDGEETVELDYRALHPNLIAEMEGVTLPDGFDPYGVYLPEYNKDCLRKLAKIAMLVLINSKSPRQAAMALSMEAYRKLPLSDWKASGLVPDPVESKRIVQAVMEHNTYALGWFAKGRGLELQNIDSNIMSYVLDRCLQEGIKVIPIHDSVVVNRRSVDITRQIMLDAYNKTLGSKINCKISEK